MPSYRYVPPDSLSIREVGGIAADSQFVYVLDSARPRVLVLSSRLEPLRTFGREGGGPGELSAEEDGVPRGVERRWIDLAADTVAVFDGRRVQLFSASGTFLRSIAQEGGAPGPGTPRIDFTGGELLFSRGGYDAPLLRPAAERYRWDLVRRVGSTEERVASMELEPLPADSGGVPFQGPRQAAPLWDRGGGCTVISDGASEWLIVADSSSPRLDTVRFRFPVIRGGPPARVKEIDALLRQVGGKGGPPQPSRVRALSGLVVDPDGTVWLLLEQKRLGGVWALLMDPGSGAWKHIVLPAFPAAFGAPGSYYAHVPRADTGKPEIVRYDVARESSILVRPP